MADQQPILFRFQIDDSGVPAPTKRTEDALKRIDQAAGAAGKGLLKFGADGKASAAQIQALSYQTSDIVTQLAGGQNPLLIMLQQGGQLRDQFGGVGNVFRAVASIVTPTAVALGGLGLALGAVALAAYQGHSEVSELTKQLALNGNAAGVTRGQIDGMAEQLAQAGRGSISAARDAVAGLATTGVFVGSTLQSAGRAVLAVQRLSGQSTEEIVNQFAGMRSGVAAWAVEANRSYNVFTAAQVQAMRSLEAQGRTQEAARLALVAVADTMESRNVPALGGLESALKSASSWWDKFWTATKGELSAETIDDKIASLQATIERAKNRQGRPFDMSGGPGMVLAGAALTQAEAELQALQRERFRGMERVAGQAAEAQKNQEEILKGTAGYQSALLGLEQSGQAKLLAEQSRGIQARRFLADEGYRANVLSAKDYTAAIIATEREKMVAEEQMARAAIAAQRRRTVSTPQDDLARRQAVLQAETQLVNVLTRRDALEARIRAEEFKRPDQESARDAFIRSELSQRNLAEGEFARWLAEQRDETIKLAAATKDYTYVLAEVEAQRRLGMDRDLDGARLGGRARERADRMAAIADQYNAGRARLDAELRTNRITQQAFDDRLQLLHKHHERAIDAEQRYQESRNRLEGDAGVGFDRALGDYLDSSRNVAAQTEQLWGNAFGGLEDALVSFATTGKASFSSLANSIVADLIRIQIRAQLTGMMGNAGSLGGLFNSIGSFFGIGGSGSVLSGTPIIPPTMAAKGLATDGVHAFAAGGIFDQPTFFRFAAGGAFRTGVMGEAGPEAILPLRRGADGGLGVVASGGGAGRMQLNLQVVNATGNPVKASATQRGDGGIDLLLEAVDQGLAERVSSGQGATSIALQQRFGLRPAMG